MQTLLLNASYEPLRLISYRRAVVLILQEKAELVEAGEEPVRSASFEMPSPLVIRLKYFVKIPYKARAALNRKTLAARDGGVCQVTGCDKTGNTIDHVVPRSKGGKNEWENVSLMCGPHNFRKSDKLLEELGWTLKSKPSVPKVNTHIIVGVAKVDPSWEPHLALA